MVEERRDQVIELLERTPFGRADLAAIREVIAALETSLARLRSKPPSRSWLVQTRPRYVEWGPSGWS